MRRKKGRILGIEDPQGNWLVTQESIESYIVDYFSNLRKTKKELRQLDLTFIHLDDIKLSKGDVDKLA